MSPLSTLVSLSLPSNKLASEQTSPTPLSGRDMWAAVVDMGKALKNWGETTFQRVLGNEPFITAPHQHASTVDFYAESPFERQLFLLKRFEGRYSVSTTWANAIRSADNQTRDAAISLFKAYMTHLELGMDTALSPHTQLKMVHFASHLDEGITGRALLFEALAAAPLEHLMEFADALRADFSRYPAAVQLVILKHYMSRARMMDGMVKKNQDAAAFKKLVKDLVISFYTDLDDDAESEISGYEHIRLGMMKLKPVKQNYKKSADEIDRRYRVMVRQVKKRRHLKMAALDEERRRHIELIYDELESELAADIDQVSHGIHQVMAG